MIFSKLIYLERSQAGDRTGDGNERVVSLSWENGKILDNVPDAFYLLKWVCYRRKYSNKQFYFLPLIVLYGTGDTSGPAALDRLAATAAALV